MIQKRINKRWLWIALLMGGYASAQPYQHKARLDSVVQTGFYAIPITPALSTLLKVDFSDLRITDSKGNPVPYLMKNELAMKDSSQFTALKIIKNLVSDSGQTVVVVENNGDEKLDAFYLRIQNAAVSRTISLSGSRDGIKWYSILENVNLEKRFIQSHDSFLENISFPLSSYRYYRVVIYNGKNDPLDIISVQKRTRWSPPAKDTLVFNPPCSFLRKDSNKVSWLTVDNSKRYHINHVFLKVKSPRFYRRQMDVMVGGEQEGSLLISSDSLVHLSLPLFNDSVFVIKIYNEDNSPLDIAGISTAQNPEAVITYLEVGKPYDLEMTSPNARKPRYDLVNFQDSIPKELKEIGLFSITGNLSVKTERERGIKQFWLWPVLLFVLIVLALFTFRLVRDMSKRP